MKDQLQPEDHAFVYAAYLRFFLKRLCEGIKAVPPANHSVTFIDVHTTEVQSFTVTIRRLSVFALSATLALSLCACTAARPQHGGKATTAGSLTQTLAQGENASQPSRQTQDTVRTRTYILPVPASDPQLSTLNSQPPLASERLETHAFTELGATQKDTARELAAKLSSLRAIVWVGLGLFLFGLASLFWPPLRAIIGSVTTSAAITLGGVGLMVLPTLIVGHELLILGAVALAVGGWFLAHRHGHARGQLAAHAATPKAAKSEFPWHSGHKPHTAKRHVQTVKPS